MKKFLFCFSLFLTGCGTTPYSDDYAEHTNTLTNGFIPETELTLAFIDENVDLRGVYNQNDTVDSTQMLYVDAVGGSAGAAGLIGQLIAHSFIIDSQRDEKLQAQQMEANQAISVLYGMTANLTLSGLVQDPNANLIPFELAKDETVRIKPIFFSDREFNRPYLTAIIWVPSNETGHNGKPLVKYRNLIQVHGDILTDDKIERLKNSDQALMVEILSALLNKTIAVVEKEMTGHYSVEDKNPQTYFIESNSRKKVVRGVIVEETCQDRVIKDLRSWVIVVPSQSLCTS
ncbi:hypothetical protein [Thaumasiovibrio subtropicus]|uniref:hypothetical protein n=1 Tax=Thaumasiovibrio subtropicus TaxID=1891207 RepID=UPI000B34BE9E|nr:hypothetical protein [Thaumasiovibrio subtropicus]